MLPDLTLPSSLLALLACFEPLFTAPSFRAFCALTAGFVAQTGRRTVCGMLTGAGLSQVWRHHRAHRFFSHARWSAEALGLALASLVVALLVAEGEPVLVAIDDTLFKRTGKKVHAIGWFHDGSANGTRQVGLGNNWVIAAVVVRLPFCSRPVALPVLARLVHKDLRPAPASRLALARQMTAALARALPGRDLHVVADAAYAGKELARLPATVTWTTRLRKDAALYELPPPRTGKRGRPRVKGKRLPSLAALAETAGFAPVTVSRYGSTATIHAAAITCLSRYEPHGAGFWTSALVSGICARLRRDARETSWWCGGRRGRRLPVRHGAVRRRRNRSDERVPQRPPSGRAGGA